MSKGRWLALFLIGIVLVSALGILIGKRIVASRAERAHQAELQRLYRGEASKLRTGEHFPEVSVTGTNGHQTTTTQLLNGEDALVIFLAPNCEGCTEAFLRWEPYLEQPTVRTRVIGIAGIGVDEATIYASESGLPFPIFADEEDAFGRRHELHVVPTVIGVRANGTIAFIRHGISEDFTPQAAEGLLANPG